MDEVVFIFINAIMTPSFLETLQEHEHLRSSIPNEVFYNSNKKVSLIILNLTYSYP